MDALTIIPKGGLLTMSSRVTGKEHRNVMRDIRAMLVELHGEGGVLSFEQTHTNPQNGQPYPVFVLPKRETLILVSGCHALLLPVRDGKHVGSYPIDNKALRGLRDSFFNSVAGPAGLKRTGAKMRGSVKRMAVAAVLKTCEAQGMPEKVGVLWPILRAAIERDPTQAVQALNLTDEDIRNEEKNASNPIGFADDDPSGHPNPIGIENHPQKTEPYLCVGFAHPTTSPAPAERAASDAEASGGEVKEGGVGAGRKCIETAEELWAAVGCRSVWKGQKKPGREMAAGGAVVKDVKAAKPARKAAPVAKVAPAASAPAPATATSASISPRSWAMRS